MIGVFVTFIRVVYGRMIYMSVPYRQYRQFWGFVNENANGSLLR